MIATHTKTAIVINIERIYFAVLWVGGTWHSKSKNFVSLTYRTTVFKRPVSKPMYQKTYFAENEVKLHGLVE